MFCIKTFVQEEGMRLPALSAMVFCLGAAGCVAPDANAIADTEVFADGPTPPKTYRCDDGREVRSSAMMGGTVIITIGGIATTLEQIPFNGLPGHWHEGNGLGWRILFPDSHAELADLAPGQSLIDAVRIPCVRIDP